MSARCEETLVSREMEALGRIERREQARCDDQMAAWSAWVLEWADSDELGAFAERNVVREERLRAHGWSRGGSGVGQGPVQRLEVLREFRPKGRVSDHARREWARAALAARLAELEPWAAALTQGESKRAVRRAAGDVWVARLEAGLDADHLVHLRALHSYLYMLRPRGEQDVEDA